jgi:TM2 domain-containing membrane protein YozV
MTAPSVQVSIPMKSTGIAYLLWLFFGGVGAHKFYLGRPLIGGLYILMFVLFWVGIIQVMAAGAEIVAVAMQQADPTIGATSRRIPNAMLGRGGLGFTWMTAPLSLALLFDLFTLPMQVRAANSRLGSETSSYRGGSAARSSASFDDDRPESERFAQIDQAIARYKAQLPKAAASPARAASPAGVATVASAGPPTFGKRR